MEKFDCLAKEISLFGPHFLEASAGTGKTFAIEHIFARLLLSGIEIDQILVVTFTRAATRELKMRIRSNLEKRQYPYLDGSLEKITAAVTAFDRNQIYTIHGFCFRMLREFAFEMELPLSMKEGCSTERIDAALRDFFQMKLNPDLVSPEQLEVLLRTTTVEELVQRLKKGETPRAAKSYSELNAAFQERMPPLELDKLREDFAALEGSYRKKEGNFDAELRALASKEFGPLISEKGSIFTFLSPENKKVKAKEPSALYYPDFFEWGREHLLPLIQTALQDTFYALLAAWKPIEEKILAEEGAFGPDALLKKMEEAIQKEAFREKVKAKYRAVLIDEFQDTDPLQWKIFQTLFLQAETLYLIGDPKQSIYRFRNADLYTYLRAKDSIDPQGHYYLDTNFRSSKELIGALNRLFDRNWLHLPKEKKTLPYLPVRAGLPLTSSFSDQKGAIHCVISEEIVSYTAAEILRLKGEVSSFGSFAILVKDRFQAAKMEEALTLLGIPNIARTHELLSESLAFEAIEELFEALEDPRHLGKTNAVAAGPLGKLDLFALRTLLEEKGLAKMCAALPQMGSDFFQVFELLFEWEQKVGFSFEGVARFFAMSRTMDPETAIHRWKETRSDAVQILTMHASKGLEFDIVFALGVGERTPLCDEEADAEKQRLLYVAMTRAKRRLYLPIPPPKKGAVGKLSPIELFCQTLGSWEQELQAIGREVSLTLERIEAPIELPKKIELPIEVEERLPPPPLFPPSYLLSFTALAQEGSSEVLAPLEAPNGLYTIHNLPRGAEVGVVIHSIFERVFSNEPFEELIPPSLLPWKGAIYAMVEEVLDHPLPMGFCLREIDRAWARTEVEFLFETSPNYLKGFIDLIFVHKGTLYFVDWKTNWLGVDASSYSTARLEASMKEHQYDLQASIYQEALRRSWQGAIGGAIYFFVRGPEVFVKI